mgnify:CR=1 FL=1
MEAVFAAPRWAPSRVVERPRFPSRAMNGARPGQENVPEPFQG